MNASRGSQCGVLSTGSLREAAFERAVPGTRHHALLTSNEPPEDSETIFILSVISEADAHLTCLDDEISRLQERLGRREEKQAANKGSEIVASVVSKTNGHSACPSLEDETKFSEKLEQLEEERASLFTYRTQNRAVLSPLRRFPPEILAQIFLWTLPPPDAAFDVAHSPWVLTWISARWRGVSVSTPSLWSRIVIDYSTASSAYSLSLAETQITRAQKLKIHLYGCETADAGPQVEMFQLFSRHSSRWEELILRLTASLVSVLPALRGRIQSLKRSWVEWADRESQTAVQSIDCFESASSLLDCGIYNEYRFVPFTLPTHHLTHYSLDGPWEQHKRILELAHNLVEADITVDFDEEPWPKVYEIIDLPYLQHLYVSDPAVMDHLRSPSLQALAIRIIRDLSADDIFGPLDPFLDRSACLLRRFTLRGFPDGTTTLKILQSLPSITELGIVIDHCDACEGITLLMSTLTVFQVPGGRVAAPQLRNLFVACEDESRIDYTVYLEMIESRWRAADCALNTATLAIEGGPGPDSATLHGLHALRQQGLDLSLPKGEEVSSEVECWELYRTNWMK